MKIWRSLSTPSVILWLLILILVAAIAAVSYVWKLEIEQILSTTLAATTIPLGFLAQQAILRENQKQKLRIDAYENIQEPLSRVRDSLIALKATDLNAGSTKLIENNIAVRQAAANFIYAYNTYEMVFIEIDLYFKYVYILLNKLVRDLDGITSKAVELQGSVIGYTGEDAEELLRYKVAKELADDINSYIYDLKKECIEVLNFSKLFNTTVEKRVVKDKKYKTLSEVATKKEDN